VPTLLEVDKARQPLVFFLSPLFQLGGPPPGMNGLAFTFRIPSHKNTRCHEHELNILLGTNPRRPKLTTAETRCSFHSLQLPRGSKPLANKTLDLPLRWRQRGVPLLRYYSLSQGQSSSSPFAIHSFTPKPAAPSEADTEETDDDHKLQNRGRSPHSPSKFARKACWPTKTSTSNSTTVRRYSARSLAGTVPVLPYTRPTHHRLWTMLVVASGSPLPFADPI